MSDDQEGIRVQLARMEGKLDLSVLRHEQHDERFKVIDNRLHSHGNRLGVLEAQNHLRDGERKGIIGSARVLYSLVGGGLLGIGALLLKAFS